MKCSEIPHCGKRQNVNCNCRTERWKTQSDVELLLNFCPLLLAYFLKISEEIKIVFSFCRNLKSGQKYSNFWKKKWLLTKLSLTNTEKVPNWTQKNGMKFRCAKFWELNVEKNSEKQNLKNFSLKNTENESLCEKKPNRTQKKKLNHQRLTAVWRHCGFCEYLESYSLNQNLFIFVMFREQMPQQQAKPAGRYASPYERHY